MNRTTLMALSAVAGIVLAFLAAFTGSTVWEWFMVPAGYEPLSMLTVYGMLLFATLFTGPINAVTIIEGQITRSDVPEELSKYRSQLMIAVMGIQYTFTLGLAWLVITLFG